MYPLLARALGGFAGAGAATIAAIAISFAAFGLALRLLHRLARLDLGQRGADATVALVAFAPVAFFFSSPYTESLFLLLSVAICSPPAAGGGRLRASRRGSRRERARPALQLLLPLAILYSTGRAPIATRRSVRAGRWAALVPRHRPSPDILWLALAPVGIVGFSLYLRHAVGDAFAWQHVQPLFGRTSTEWPTETVRQGVVAAFHAVKGDGPAVYRGPIMLESVYLLLALAATAGVFRRLPFAYGAYSLGALLVALSSPAYLEPLRALPRYVLPIFPMTMWLAHWTERRGVTRAAVLASAAALAVLTAAFASGQPFV